MNTSSSAVLPCSDFNPATATFATNVSFSPGAFFCSAVNSVLYCDAASQYKTLFTALQKKAPGEKLTLVAKVAVAGLKSLHGNTAELLVFIDQSSTRASDKQKSTSAAQLDVTAVKHGSTWKVTELRPL